MTRTLWFSDYADEYELDSEGNAMEMIDGQKPTARAKAAEHAWLRIAYRPEKLEPLDQLPPELLARHTRKKGWEDPPRYSFGWGISFQQLYDYSIRRRLMPNEYHGKFDWSVAMVEAVVKELDHRCAATLYLKGLTNAKDDWILVRFSNFT